ncbi:MAG: hypothetical protein JNG85_15680 [Spirochaetaceae bacterium]|nr:hypothetical protein [Spirochaetaceae bacterium]
MPAPPPSAAIGAADDPAPPGKGGFVLEPGALPPALGGGDARREKALRRFEIVALGSFPFTLFYTGLGFDTAGYIDSGFEAAYAPWPFKNERSVALTSSERLVRLGVAAGASLVIAGIDALIRGMELRREAEASRRLLETGSSGDSRGSELDSGGGPH